MMRSVILLVVFVLCAACKKHIKVHYKTDANLNATPGMQGQPVLVGIYPLSKPPDELQTASCDRFQDDLSTKDFLKEVLVGEVDPISMVPDERSSVRVPRYRGARWLMIVPFFEDKCSHEADRWALVRLWPLTRQRSVTLSAYDLALPWDRRPWRQGGCVDGRASHVGWSICE